MAGPEPKEGSWTTSVLACPACGVTDPCREVERIDGYRLVLCTSCGLEYSDPMKAGDAAWYDAAYVIRHGIIDTRIRSYFQWAVRRLPKCGRLLDVGCGAGIFVRFALRKGFDAFGLDFSEEAVSVGRTQGASGRFFKGSPKDMAGSGTGTFQIVTVFEVIEHTENPGNFLQDIRCLLGDKGFICASVPFRDRWPIREQIDYPPHHLTRWTPEAFRALFERNGFEIRCLGITSGFDSYWQFLGYFLRMVFYKVLGVPIRPTAPEKPGLSHRWLRRVWVRKGLSFFRLRYIRDMLTLPLAVLTYPFLKSRFQGYHLMVLATKI